MEDRPWRQATYFRSVHNILTRARVTPVLMNDQQLLGYVLHDVWRHKGCQSPLIFLNRDLFEDRWYSENWIDFREVPSSVAKNLLSDHTRKRSASLCSSAFNVIVCPKKRWLPSNTAPTSAPTSFGLTVEILVIPGTGSSDTKAPSEFYPGVSHQR